MSAGSRLQISAATPLLLGSGSPRRRDILQGLGLPIVVRPSDAPEDLVAGDTVSTFIERVVRAKLDATLAQNAAALNSETQHVAGPNTAASYAAALVADTIVVVDGDILGKPRDVADAYELLKRIAGRTHEVVTRYAIAPPRVGAALFRSVTTSVALRPASDSELRSYAASGEGLDKAGAYAAQGLGAFLIQGITGSYTNVVGLPAMEVVQDLLALGLLSEFPLAGSHAS